MSLKYSSLINLSDEGLEEVIEIGSEILVSEVSILREDISSQIIILVLAIQQQQVTKCFRGKWILLKKELELAKPVRGLQLHVHQSLYSVKDIDNIM